ncbi:MAG: amidohydrolase family protein [Steroidobacteraceae bacterium]
MDRRQLLAGMSALAATPAFAQDDIPRWSSPVIDMHFHTRGTVEQNIAHQIGAGITAVSLISLPPSPLDIADIYAKCRAQNAAMFPVWFGATDLTTPGFEARLTAQVKAGAKGFGEVKMPVDADGPQMRRVYALAADLGVPVLVHFQDPIGDSQSFFNRGLRRFAPVLQANPRTKFIAHANSFWANVSASNDDTATYPTGPVVRGGISDKLLSDYPNMFADLSATSCNTFLSRDAAFSTDFLKRHQDKLHFGSDCFCEDGRGGSAAQAGGGRAAVGRGAPATGAVTGLRGKCLARENLGLVTRLTTPEIFRKMAWTNAHRLIGLPA